VLREYAMLADGRRGALVGPRGDIGWLCAPHWDSPSIFSALVGGSGAYSVTPADPFVWGGYYEIGSLIWHSRWVTHAGVVESREALTYPGDDDRLVLLRRIIAVDAPARMDVVLRPRGNYDQTPVKDWQRDHHVWHGSTGQQRIRWSGADAARPFDDDALAMRIELEAGASHDLVLEVGKHLPDDLAHPDQLWRATEAAWEREMPSLGHVLAPRDTRHSYAVLRGLTGPGGTLAAATTSLPERSGQGRSYDYRYVWIRDQCYVGQAMAACGPVPLLEEAVQTVAEHVIADGPHLAPAYTAGGDQVPAERHLKLPGYPGGYDIVGNHVRDQFQLDAFGEALLLFAAAGRHDMLDARAWQAVDAAVEAVGKRWQDPDAGIWELDDRAWTHSRLIVAAGLRAVAAQVSGGRAGELLGFADRIVADTARTSVHPDGRWQRAPDDPAADAALLFAGLRGAVPADDPRTIATLDGYLADLTVDGYAYRFRHDERPLADAEGSFLLCGFLTALALHQQGRTSAAVGWFERSRSACGPPQLFSEEYDSRQHQMRGNLPQAFVHALMIECSARLANEE
jgi:GH15 family glucan-1,4-alpha-glucosidase